MTLLADEDGVYDPVDTHDRFLLGLTGIISEFELITMRNRLEHGRLHKAQRGELFYRVPTGYIKLSSDRAALTSEPRRVAEIAFRLLERHFPESLHSDILNAVGLSLEETVMRRKRDPAFRKRVLRTYEYRCAVCGFDVRLGTVPIALDAAHIRWHQAGGPETESNGLALCVLHHKTFDLGAFTVAEGVLLVSDQANGMTGFQETFMAYHGRPIRDPQHPDWRPDPQHLDWHGREVFKGEARHRG